MPHTELLPGLYTVTVYDQYELLHQTDTTPALSESEHFPHTAPYGAYRSDELFIQEWGDASCSPIKTPVSLVQSHSCMLLYPHKLYAPRICCMSEKRALHVKVSFAMIIVL